MKKAIVLLCIFFLFGCTPEQTQAELNCKCETVVSATSYNLPNGMGNGVVVYTTMAVQNDCTHYQHNITLQGTYVVGQKICN